MGANTAGLLVERQTRAYETSSIASQVDSIAAATGGNAAAIAKEAVARTTEKSALATQVNTLAVATQQNAAAIQLEQTVRADAVEAVATQVTTLQSKWLGTVLSLPLEQWSVGTHTFASVTDGKAGNTALRLGITASVAYQPSYIAIDRTKTYRVRFWARPSADTNGVLYFSLRQFLDNTGSAGPINGGRAPYKPSTQSRASHIAKYGDTWGEYSYTWSSSDWQAGVNYVQPEFLRNYGGTAGYWEVQGFSITDDSAAEAVAAALQVLATTTAGADGATAQYTVKTDVAGRVAGFGLSSTGNTAGTGTSEFAVLADKFYVAPPSDFVQETQPAGTSGKVWYKPSTKATYRYDGAAWVAFNPVIPFVVQTTPTTYDGVSVPAGVYMDAAYIKNGTISGAKIGTAEIDSAKISSLAADKITSGAIAVGAEIKSSNYVTGTSGWRIHGNGDAELSNATVRGTVYATNGQFWGTLLGGAATAYSSGLGFYAGGGSTTDGADYRWRVGNPTGARIQWSGSAVEVYGSDNKVILSAGTIIPTNTNQLTDGAGLGSKAVWGNITGTGKPADNATNNVVSQGALASRPTGTDGDFYYATDTGAMYQKIAGSWVLASNKTSIDASGNIQGVENGAGLSVANNTDNVIRAPGGGVYVNGASSVAGRMKIKLPQLGSNTMMRFTVEVYEYAAGYMCTLEIGGYNYSGGWINVTARVIGGSNVEYPVYFGRDEDTNCIWIGSSTTETWSYPQVRVRDFFAGYSNATRAKWEAGWVISFDQTAITSGTGVNQYSQVVLDTLPGANWGKLSGKPAFGNFATLSKIDSTNISTYIETAAIGSAYIKDLNASKITAGTITTDKIVSGSVARSFFHVRQDTTYKDTGVAIGLYGTDGEYTTSIIFRSCYTDQNCFVHKNFVLSPFITNSACIAKISLLIVGLTQEQNDTWVRNGYPSNVADYGRHFFYQRFRERLLESPDTNAGNCQIISLAGGSLNDGSIVRWVAVTRLGGEGVSVALSYESTHISSVSW